MPDTNGVVVNDTSIDDGCVNLPGLGSMRGWFESSAVHYGTLEYVG